LRRVVAQKKLVWKCYNFRNAFEEVCNSWGLERIVQKICGVPDASGAIVNWADSMVQGGRDTAKVWW